MYRRGGVVGAFAFLGGVLRSILYDNTTLAVARILGDGSRRSFYTPIIAPMAWPMLSAAASISRSPRWA